MNKEKEIKKIIEEFFEKMTTEQEVKDIELKEAIVSFKIEAEEPEILIGKGGQTLSDIERILARIISKKIEENIFIDLDVNQYKEKKTEYLKEIAKEAADEVFLTGQEKVLPVMNAFERRIVHLELKDKAGVLAESQGIDPERRIVVKPA